MPPVDLVITSGTPTVTPLPVLPGETVQLSPWTVKNQGMAAVGFFSNGYYLSTDGIITSSDIFLDSNNNTELAAGASYNWAAKAVTIPPGTAPGSYYIGILVDRSNSVAESNEENNYVSTSTGYLDVGKSDLVITSGPSTVTPSSVAPCLLYTSPSPRD